MVIYELTDLSRLNLRLRDSTQVVNINLSAEDLAISDESMFYQMRRPIAGFT